MLILALETSADLCSVAVRDEKGTLVERLFRHRMHLLERLMGDVDAVLHDAGVSLAGIDGFAVGLGPGSFTGVRIGVMTVKTWAAVSNKPVCGFTAFDALAEEYRGVEETLVVPIIRARPGCVYFRFYRHTEGHMRALNPPEMRAVSDFVQILASAGAERLLLCGEGLASQGEAIREAAKSAGVPFASGRSDPPRASVFAALAASALAAGQSVDPLQLVPVYIAPPPIDPRAERLTGSREQGDGEEHMDSE